MHLHFDIHDYSKEEILALYILYMRLQDEILDFLPVYISNQVSIGRKSRDYSARLQPLGIPFVLMKKTPDENVIKELYTKIKEIYTWKNAEETITTAPWAGSPWMCASRYVALNLVPFFTSKQTCEFRAHPPTLNYTEVIDWIAICASILHFCRTSTEFILNSYMNGNKINLMTIISAIENNDLRLHLMQTIDNKTAARAAQLINATSTANLNASGVDDRNRRLMKMYEEEFKAQKNKPEASIYGA